MEKNTFELLNILLVESNFWRHQNVKSDKESQPDFKIGTQDKISDNKLAVAVTVEFNFIVDDKEVVKTKTRMVGNFIINNSANKDFVEGFAKINAPAIIFPYIREHLATTSAKAGIYPILLQPFNFVEFVKGSEKNEKV